jgi:serine/threonine protein kinase
MCKVNEDGTVNEKCHSVIDLSDFKIGGLEGKGCIADREWIEQIYVPCYASNTDSSLLIDLPNHKVKSVVKMEDGAHGVIEGGFRTLHDVTQRIFIKRSKKCGSSLLQEALVQKVVYRSLIRGGFPNGAPDVYDLIGMRDGTVCFTMEPKAGIKLQELIESKNGFELSKLIIESLFIISAMVSHIVNDIGMNHRDLKPSNLIVIEREKPFEMSLKVDKIKVTIRSNFDICFVDFGFSCIGIEDGKGGGSLKISREYEEDDPCPKEGRDMYMFLAFMYFYTHRKLQTGVQTLFEKWLNVDGCKMTDYLKSPTTAKEVREVLDSIYTLCGEPQVKRMKTTPEKIIRDLISYTSA